ncbi:MAG: hypothetical protein K6A41_04030 [Bacteroidales bacterium]|nr:hypothetical protein [Bacteroidales bacterium]
MKKLSVILLFFSAILLLGCGDKTVTNHYSIGCLAYTGLMQYSDWDGFEECISSQVTYNEQLSFTSESKEENDAKAVAYFNEQAEKLETDTLCTFIAPGDQIIYGVGYSVSDSSFYILKGIVFSSTGTFEFDEQFAIMH